MPSDTGAASCERFRDLGRDRLTRRQFLTRAAAAGVSLAAAEALLTACDGKNDTTSGETSPSFAHTKPASITLLNWREYMSPKCKSGFAAATGIEVHEEFIENTNEEFIAKVRAGSHYDVILPEEYAAEVLIRAGLLLPLDMSLLPNFTRYVTEPLFRAPPYDPGTGGKKYTSVYMFGTEGIAVRSDKIANPEETWRMLYDQRNRGRIVMDAGYEAVLGPALFLLGSDQNCTDTRLIDKATRMAVKQKPLVAAYDAVHANRRIADGVPLVECQDGDAIDAMKTLGLDKVRYVLPKEGFIMWADAPCIPRDAPSPYAAHLFLDYLCLPEVAAENADYLGFQPVIAAAGPFMSSLVQRAMRPSDDLIERGTFSRDLGSLREVYVEAYKKVMAS